MYNDVIKAANKIISDADIAYIIEKIDEDIKLNQKLCEEENIKNERFEREYQNWTVKNFEGSFKCRFDFYDDTSVDVDNYFNFSNIYNNRLQDIKNMYVRITYHYSLGPGNNLEFISNHITMDIFENKMNIEASLSSKDNKMENIFNTIKEKILMAPEKYDRVIRKRNLIMNKVGMSIGLIPSMILCLLLIISPDIRNIYGTTIVGYPVIVVILAFIIGGVVSNAMLGKYYAPLLPEKKYAGYDSSAHKSVYTDDIQKYVDSSEIIIGRNVNNLKYRQEIVDIENKYSKFLPYELIALLVISIIVIIIGKLV